MCTDQQIRKTESVNLRIEPVDNWHTHWPSVLESIASHGHREALMVDRDGWLSARQVLLVAFNDSQNQSQVAGHICFRIVPITDDAGQIIMQAHLDAFGVRPGFESIELGPALRQAAQQRAESLKCTSFVGF
jgi:predicted N-acetyltransferase YhbS